MNLNEVPKDFKIKVLRETFPDKTGSAIRVMEERAKVFANILWNRKKKYQKDKIDFEKALNSSNKIFQQLMNSKTPVLNEKLREKLLEGKKELSFDTLDLHKNETALTDGLISLCSKSQSFVPVPPHSFWLQLQKDFDRSRNSLMSRVFFCQ